MIDVLFLVLPGSLLLDIAGPAEAFRLANQQLRKRGRDEMFRLRYVGPVAEAASSVGLVLAALEPLPETLRPPTWVVLLGRPGEAPDVVRRQRAWLQARDWLARCVAPQLARDAAAPPRQAGPAGAVRLLTVCSGALLAADAGLVGGRRVTTHHELLDDLARMAPAATVQGNRLFVEDGPLLSSAGITAGIDLALQLVTQTCGAAVAAAVAQVMVVFTRRGPQEPQRSPLLSGRDHIHPAVHRVQDAVCADPALPWSAERLAQAAHVTPRHLARLFRRHAGLSPRDYVEQVRAGIARHAMEHGMAGADAAALAGLGTRRRLRQALARVPPGQAPAP
jgi:transcriptional regulator GlxA family with amidase domain